MESNTNLECVNTNRPDEGAKCKCCCNSFGVSQSIDISLSSESISLLTAARNADSPTKDKEGDLLFVKPCEEEQPFDEFLKVVSAQELDGDSSGEVRYAQTRKFTILTSSQSTDITVLLLLFSRIKLIVSRE